MTSQYPVVDPGYFGEPVYTPPTATPPTDQPSPVVPPPATPAPLPGATPAPINAPPSPTTPRRARTALPVPVVVGQARYAAADYASAGRALMPRGRAWPDDQASVQARLLAALAQVFARSDADGQAVLGGALPGALTPMLPEWEATLALPDPCAGGVPTLPDRLAQVRGRFVGAGGQSRAALIAFAAALGFTITLTNYAPFRVGQTTVGQPLAGDEWRFVLGVRIVANPGGLPVDVLLCELETVKPAEMTLLLLN